MLSQLVTPTEIVAQETRTWDDADSANSFFELPENWVGGLVPDSDDNVLFNTSGTHEVWFDELTDIPEVGSMRFTSGNFSFVNRNATRTNPILLGLTGSGPTGFALDVGIPGAASGRRLTVGGFHLSTTDARVNEFNTLNLEGSDVAGTQLNASDRLRAIGGTINVRDGATVTSGRVIADSDNLFTTGTINVTGPGSQWDNSDSLVVGALGRGRLDITSGGVLNTVSSEIGAGIGSIRGTVVVGGEDSEWNTTNLTTIGGPIGFGVTDSDAFSLVTIANGGRANTGQLIAGVGAGSTTVIQVDGEDAVYDVAGQAIIADRAETELIIENGGRFEANSLELSRSAGSLGSIRVQDDQSRLSVSGAFNMGIQGDSELIVQNSGSVNASSMTVDSAVNANVVLRESGSEISVGTLRVGSGASGNVSISEGGLLLSGVSTLGDSATGDGTISVADSGSEWSSSGLLTVGQAGTGNLAIRTGGEASAKDASIGGESGGVGNVTVEDSGSLFTASTSLTVGAAGTGILDVVSGATAEGGAVDLGRQLSGNGTINIEGAGSLLDAQVLNVGISGTGSVNVRDQWNLLSSSSTLGSGASSVANVNVSGAGSLWANSGDLTIGAGGTADLTVVDDGNAIVTGTTSIGSNGQVNLLGGTFEFGQGTLEEFANINSVSGKLVGNLLHSSFTDVATLSGFRPTAVDMSDVLIKNDGVLRGSGELNDFTLQNSEIGEIQTFTNEQIRFGGSVENFGEIKNFGGLLRIEGNLVNDSSGFISGRGVLIVGGEIRNEGVMAFTGDTDIEGDLTMAAGSSLVTSGFSTTTLFDDLIHNGAEIRTSAGSATVLLGEATGSGSYTGTGTVFFEGDLRPGNSPDIVSFGGDVVLGTNADTFIELGGNLEGLFDQLLIDGDFDIDGDLSVSLIDGFELAAKDQFLIADVDGSLTGRFDGLEENALVGNFGGRDLFITYNGFGGNAGVGLFTAVPEPGSGVFIVLAMSLISMRRQRYKR